MHPYATDSDERRNVRLFLAALSVALAFGFPKLLTILRITPPWWIDVPSVIGFYALLHEAFDKWLWRLTPLRFLFALKVPSLDGNWEGYVTSSFDDHRTDHSVCVRIRQTWTQLSVTMESDSSKSHSLLGGILADDPHGVVLTYQYLNEPDVAKAKKTMNIHYGTARLTLSSDRRSLDGDYYSARGRQNVGILHLERVNPT